MISSFASPHRQLHGALFCVQSAPHCDALPCVSTCNNRLPIITIVPESGWSCLLPPRASERARHKESVNRDRTLLAVSKTIAVWHARSLFGAKPNQNVGVGGKIWPPNACTCPWCILPASCEGHRVPLCNRLNGNPYAIFRLNATGLLLAYSGLGWRLCIIFFSILYTTLNVVIVGACRDEKGLLSTFVNKSSGVFTIPGWSSCGTSCVYPVCLYGNR